jgi:cellulose synthase (UDP-forming)
VLGFAVAILYGGIQILGNWAVYLAIHHRSPNLPLPAPKLSVDVFIPTCGEDHELVEQALAAACAMRGEHQIWLLDDTRSPALAKMAKQLGVGYLTRPSRIGNKPGNVNAALARTTGDIIVIFDLDHFPTPDFLEHTVGHFADSRIGFVQVMISFRNADESWVARAATEASLDFYNPTSLGMDGLGSATKMGTNALIRRAALESIGGYQYGLADDLATSMALHAAGWRSVYVAEPLAPGLVPADLVSWFIQQFKWARGVFEIQLTSFSRLFSRLTMEQRLSYAVRLTYYLAGPVIFVHLLLTLALLFSRNSAAQAGFQEYLIHFIPLTLSSLSIRMLALRRWRHPSISANSLGRAMFLVYATWPLYTLAWVMALLRIPLPFRLTPKEQTGRLKSIWMLPQALAVLLLSGGIIYSFAVGTASQLGLLLGWAAAQSIPNVVLLWQWFRTTMSAKPGLTRHEPSTLASAAIVEQPEIIN